MCLTAPRMPPDFVSQDDSTPSSYASSISTAETYASELQPPSTLDADKYSDASSGTSIVDIRSFDSGYFDNQPFEPQLTFPPPTTYNPINWSALGLEPLYETHPGIGEEITTHCPKFENYPHPRVPTESGAPWSSVSNSDQNCARLSHDYMVQCTGARFLANSTQLARYREDKNVCSSTDISLLPMRGWSPDVVPGCSDLSCPNHAFTKQVNQPDYQCSLCPQYFKRRDNIKPHVRKKHPEQYEVLYPPPTAPNPSNYTSSALDEPPTVPNVEYNECPNTINLLSLELMDQVPIVGQLSDGSPTKGMARQKRSHEVASPVDLDVLGRSEMRSASRLKTQRESLACPFQKRNPLKYQGCFGVSLIRIKDVKQHIYRCHSSPEYYCAACYEAFDTASDRDNHTRRRECKTLEPPFWQEFEGVSEDQRKQLSKKSLRTLSVEDQWYQLWDLVFPSQERPRSAYRCDFLAEIVPILRQEWEIRKSEILQDADGVDAQKLDSTMAKFFRYLEGETAKYKHQIGDRYEATEGGWKAPLHSL